MELMVCRSCGSESLQSILSLGKTPLANALLLPTQLDKPEDSYPLDVVLCRHCSLVQLTEVVPPQILFKDYVYFSSFSDALVRHAEELVNEQITARNLGAGQLIIEIASNDGYLLQHYRNRGIAVLGIEPSENIAQAAREQRQIDTLCEFFSEDLALRLKNKGQAAEVIHANNVMAHIADVNGFARGLKVLLKQHSVAIIEVPYVKDLIDHVEFDTIYHEHLYYFSLTAIVNLFGRHGLSVTNVQRIPIHGGSLRIFVSHAGEPPDDKGAGAVQTLLREEADWGVHDANFYQQFNAQVASLKESLVTLLRKLRNDNRRIAAYGASAKGSTLLNFFGIGKDLIDFVVDRSSVKQGRYTPGTRLPIHATTELVEQRPDYVLLLTWNFAEEILQQQHEFRQMGGRFIIPIPEVRIV